MIYTCRRYLLTSRRAKSMTIAPSMAVAPLMAVADE
jgi:hypothetical protein